MESKKEINDEVKEIAPGFPERKSLDPPEGYFETFSELVLNRWRREESHSIVVGLDWKKAVGIAALLSGICIGGWFVFSSNSTNKVSDVTSVEAYQYINENINDFETLIETENIKTNDAQTDIPQQAIDEYLIEELHGSNPEDLF